MQENYNLEYGKSSLSIQKETIKKFNSYVIIDDLLATGGTANCVANLINKVGKEVSGLLTVVELTGLKGRSNFKYPVYSMVSF